jgi:hypothetical protein
MEITIVHGQDVQTFIDDQQGQIMIITVVVERTTGQHVRSKCQLAFIADHSELETAGAVERESRKQQVWDKVERLVNRSGFHSLRQNN